MDLDLTGRTALVTGSTAGIGRAIAQDLASMGARVAINGRTPARVEETIRSLRRERPEANLIAAPGDVGTAEGARAVLDAVARVDILVNNAGVYEPKPFLEIPDADWERLFRVNVLSGVRLTRAYLPAMIQAGFGRVVFVSSESALQIPVEMIHYGMTKTAQLAVSRGVAESVAGTGVTVNAVLPGPTLSDGVARFLGEMGARGGVEEAGRAFVAQHRPTSLLGRLARVEEVSSLVAYLCSPAASATTGAALRVDGGVVRAIV